MYVSRVFAQLYFRELEININDLYYQLKSLGPSWDLIVLVTTSIIQDLPLGILSILVDNSQPRMLSSISSSPQSLVGFVSVLQESLSILEQGIEFLEYYRYSPILYLFEYELVCEIVKGLTLPLCLASKHLIVVGLSLYQFINNLKTYIESISSVKFIGNFPKSEGPPNRDQYHFHPVSSVLIAYQSIGGSKIYSIGHSR